MDELEKHSLQRHTKPTVIDRSNIRSNTIEVEQNDIENSELETSSDLKQLFWSILNVWLKQPLKNVYRYINLLMLKGLRQKRKTFSRRAQSTCQNRWLMQRVTRSALSTCHAIWSKTEYSVCICISSNRLLLSPWNNAMPRAFLIMIAAPYRDAARTAATYKINRKIDRSNIRSRSRTRSRTRYWKFGASRDFKYFQKTLNGYSQQNNINSDNVTKQIRRYSPYFSAEVSYQWVMTHAKANLTAENTNCVRSEPYG